MPQSAPMYQDHQGNPLGDVPDDDREIPPLPRRDEDEHDIDPTDWSEEKTTKLDGWVDLDAARRRVDAGLRCAKDRAPLTPEQRQLAEAHEGLAIWWAQKRWRRAKRVCLEWADVVVACKLGIEDAAARYDPSRGKFAPYARGFILSRIARMHREWDDDQDDDPQPPKRRTRGPATKFEILEDPMVLGILRRAAETGMAPFGVGHVDLLYRRSVLRLSQAEIAFADGITVQTVSRDEKQAIARIAPYLDRIPGAYHEIRLIEFMERDADRHSYGADLPTTRWPPRGVS